VLPPIAIICTPQNQEQALAMLDALAQFIPPSNGVVPVTPATAEVAPGKNPRPAKLPIPSPVPVDSPAADESSPPTLEVVRAKLAAISQAGKTAQVRQLLLNFGVDRLTALDPKDFAELLAQAEAL
jgi:hypothetical protein